MFPVGWFLPLVNGRTLMQMRNGENKVSDSDTLRTLAVFHTPIEAHVLKAKLDSESIPCVVSGERGRTISWSSPLGGVRLQVRQADFIKATHIVEAANKWSDQATKQQKNISQSRIIYEAFATLGLAVFVGGTVAAINSILGVIVGLFVLMYYGITTYRDYKR